MRQIFKILLGIVILVLLFIFGAPFIMSLWIANQYPKILQQISADNPKLKIELLFYERGWFSAQARLKVTLKSRWLKIYEQNNNKASSFIVDQTIGSGPIILDAGQFNKNASIFSKAFISTRSEDPSIQFKITSLWTFDNNLQTNFAISTLGIGNRQQQIQLVDLSGDVNYHINSQTAQIDFTLGSGNLTHKQNMPDGKVDENTLRINAMESTGDYNRRDGFWFGKRSLKVDKLLLSHNDEAALEITGLMATIDHVYQSQTSTFSTDLHVEKLTAQNIVVGPAEINISFANLDNNSLIHFISALSETQNIPTNPLENLATLAGLINPTAELLSKGVKVELHKLDIDTDSDIDTTTDKVLAKGTLDLAPHQQQTTLTDVNKFIKAQSEIKFTRNLLNRILVHYYTTQTPLKDLVQSNSPEQHAALAIQHWIDNKMLIPSGAILQFSASYQEGKLLINGVTPDFSMPAIQSLPSTPLPPSLQPQVPTLQVPTPQAPTPQIPNQTPPPQPNGQH